ncbi:peptidoglycan editing factor PgeF [Paraurantiacibacter namhicola]|uniref:Purine nucleoside phosphorylase n=1 Tax=Paraurantiacibacter namhicola TaxID=645517 RepID=A0A1C7D5B1_9SPHN|nr:peptidoglycan editing factor PgeF [Paraurantiacibacter namhicola]ANU06657.1 Laccase domain protein YfiH [Paraurantiacibacter namhicola]
MATEAPPHLRAPALGPVPHGFFGSEGGVSAGEVAGLNVGYGAEDDPACVATNRRLAADAVLPGAQVVAVYQVHSPDVVSVPAPWGDDARPEADALVTSVPGLLLGIVTADCAPVLLADTSAGVVGAAHAGWRGAHSGVLENTLAAMEELGAARGNIAAAIGPCIAQASYEVDAGFRAQFSDADAHHFAAGREGHWQFDLPGYVAARLEAAGVGHVEDTARDTYPPGSGYFSFRRATHRAEATYGRQFSLIGLPQD